MRTLCNSSCVYALIGAATREVAAGARSACTPLALGLVHERALTAQQERAPARQGSRRSTPATWRIERYIDVMGIDRALFEAAAR